MNPTPLQGRLKPKAPVRCKAQSRARLLVRSVPRGRAPRHLRVGLGLKVGFEVFWGVKMGSWSPYLGLRFEGPSCCRRKLQAWVFGVFGIRV